MSNTIPHWLSKQAYLAPQQTAIELENGTEITFLELCQQSQLFAQKLAKIGVKKGSHVGIFSNNNIQMIIAIHAISYLGAVAVLLNTRLTSAELQYQINDAEVTLLLTTEQLSLSVKKLSVQKCSTFTEVWQKSPLAVHLQKELQLDNPFVIIYTSGTTGNPKGVIHTYGNYWWSAVGSALNLGLSLTDKWLAVLPFFHVGGLSIFFRSVIYGIPVYLMEKFSEQSVHEAIFHKGVTIISVVTVMLQRLSAYLGETNKYPDSFRCMLLGGGPAPKPILEKAKQQNIPVFQSYGMTETASQIVTLSPSDALSKLGSAGKPLFPAQLKIKDNEKNKVGEIFVKGPMVTKGYFKNEQATGRSIHDGWLATGDLGYLDEEGFLYVVDRRTDLIISGGENIYPSEVESVLSGMDAVQEVAVIGQKDEKWGQVPVAFIVKQAPVTKDEIFAYLSQQLAKYKIPKQIIFVEQLPRNAANKIMRRKLIELL